MDQIKPKFKYFENNTDKQDCEILKNFDRDPISIKEDIKSVKKWFSQQPHLAPFKISDMQILSFLSLNKFSVENTKSKIDMYFSYRSIYSDIFQNTHPDHPKMREILNHIYVVPSPKISKDLTRFFAFVNKDYDIETFDVNDLICYIYNIADVRLFEDLSFGNHFFVDAKNIKMGHVTRCSPVIISKLIKISEQVFSLKFSGMHLINAPSYVESFINIVKSILKAKIANRIYIHPNMESVFKVIDKSVVPSDFGGDNISLAEMQEKMTKAFKEYKPFFDEKENWKVDENLRPEQIKNDEYLGYQGNFKQLNFD